MTLCNLCGDSINNQSYFMREKLEKGIGQIIEVCPECHHFYTYAEKDILENYKKRRNIK